MDSFTSLEAATQFKNLYLSRYPRPANCIHDQGPEFIGWEFQQMLARNGIKSKPITEKNPQANSIIERAHQTMANQLRALFHRHRPQNVIQVRQLIDTAIASTIYAFRATVHGTLKTTPGAIVFNRDMLLNIPLVADLRAIRDHRQQIIDKQLRRANLKRVEYDWTIGDKVLVKSVKVSKLGYKFREPYLIHQVHANGNVTIQRKPGVLERINIRRLRPYTGNKPTMNRPQALAYFELPS